MPFISVSLTIVDGRNKSSTLTIPVNIENGGLTAIPAVVRYIAHVTSRLVNAGIKSAKACVEVDVSSVWGLGQLVGDVEQGALPEVNEKALFSFRTAIDAQGKSYPFTITLPAVDDSKVFVDGTDTVNTTDVDVAEFIDMFENGEADLSDVNYGGQVSDAFSIVDSRYMDINSFVGGDRTWGNRRK